MKAYIAWLIIAFVLQFIEQQRVGHAQRIDAERNTICNYMSEMKGRLGLEILVELSVKWLPGHLFR